MSLDQFIHHYIYIFYSPEMVASKKKYKKIKNIHQDNPVTTKKKKKNKQRNLIKWNTYTK